MTAYLEQSQAVKSSVYLNKRDMKLYLSEVRFGIMYWKPATDIDIATSAEPEEVKAVFPMTVDIGTAHGTVLV